MSDFHDLTTDPAHRCFLQLGDDTRISISINCERRVFRELDGSTDILPDVRGEWEADPRLLNGTHAEILHALSLRLAANPFTQNLDHVLPKV